mmetsp:Transcript_69853/g.116014  ORF Transcript_69853/g.116014 Transcript_69853/m.116014 type:complete len:205 (-) Transcript_69853:643-1257(-)
MPGSLGGCAEAWATPSAKTRRPSASVLLISQVFPERKHRMSSCRKAPGPMAFSARQRHRCSAVCCIPLKTAASNAASIAAAPPMSAFMPHMPSLGFSPSPPVSYTMPLPTRQTVFAALAGRYESTTSAGGSCAAFPTPHSPPYPPSRSASPDMTLEMTLWPFALSAAAMLRASAVNAVLVSCSGGVSTRRAARRTLSAAVWSDG